MSQLLERARELANKQAAEIAANRARLEADIRQATISIVTGDNPPTPEMIFGLCESAGVGIDYFDGEDGTIARCKRRIDQAAGIDQIPELRRQAEQLESLAVELEASAKPAKAKHETLFGRLKNLGDGTFSLYRQEATAEQLAEFRESRSQFLELCDRVWLAQRDAKLLREKIAKLEKIDRNLIDRECGEKPGFDFRLPPLGN